MHRLNRWIAAAILLVMPACGNAQQVELIPSLQKLADDGNAEAIYHLGMAHHVGAGVPKDPVKALEAFRKAAALGDPLAAYKLGCYYDGQGGGLVADDLGQALKHKLAAAEAGYALAQQDVGILYLRSDDAPAGLAWLEKAADQGWAGALMVLASVHNDASAGVVDAAKTAAYFRLFLDRAKAGEDQRKWLSDFQAKLTDEDRERAAAIIRNYDPVPTALTLKALSGQRAAEALIQANPERQL